MEKNKLHPLSSYSAIGFDLDHSLARYALKEFVPIAYKSLARSMCELKGYPEELMELTKREVSFMHNGIVIDLKTGMILKLCENKTILRAYYGFKKVSKEKIETIYGSPPKFPYFDPMVQRTDAYICCLAYYEAIYPPLFAGALECKTKAGGKILSESDLREIFDDVLAAAKANWIHFDEEKYHTIESYGYFWKDMIKNIHLAIYKQNRLLKALKLLKSKGKVLFIVSNAQAEPAVAILNQAFGSEWKDLFDFVIAKGGKPRFFTHGSTTFKELDETKPTWIGKETSELQKGKIYLEGNADLLEKQIDKLAGEKGSRIAYFGDQYLNDVIDLEHRDRWDGICVMEELGGVEFGDDIDREIWGDFFVDEDFNLEKATGFWWSFVKSKVAKVTSTVDSDEMIQFFEEEEAKEVKSE